MILNGVLTQMFAMADNQNQDITLDTDTMQIYCKELTLYDTDTLTEQEKLGSQDFGRMTFAMTIDYNDDEFDIELDKFDVDEFAEYLSYDISHINHDEIKRLKMTILQDNLNSNIPTTDHTPKKVKL